jgi:hypothetical protein
LLSKPERAVTRRHILDTVVASETPEGILLELRPAGLGARYYAFIVDWVIRLAVINAAAMVVPIMGGIGVAFWLILIFALEWLYPVVFELSAAGATPGKHEDYLCVREVGILTVAVVPATSRKARCENDRADRRPQRHSACRHRHILLQASPRIRVGMRTGASVDRRGKTRRTGPRQAPLNRYHAITRAGLI